MTDTVRTLAAGAVSDAVFSADGGTLYAAQGSTISAYSATTGTLLHSWAIGANIGAIDITPDGAHVFATEATDVNATSRSVYSLDVGSGAIQTFTGPVAPFSGTSYGVGYIDVAALNDHEALLTLTFPSDGKPLQLLDLTSGTVSAVDTAVPFTDGGPLIEGQGRNGLLLGNRAGFRAQLATLGTDGTILATTGTYLQSPPGGNGALAISIEANRIVQFTGAYLAYDTGLHLLGDISANFTAAGITTPAGMVFNAAGTELFVLDSTTDLIYAFSTSDWHFQNAISAGSVQIDPFVGTKGGRLLLAPDGLHFAVSSAAGLNIIDDSSANAILGTSAAETLTGTENADTIVGGGGDDTIYGLGGDDVISGSGNKIIDGGNGTDTLVINRDAYGLRIALSVLPNNDVQLTFDQYTQVPIETDTLRSVERIQFNDVTYNVSDLIKIGTAGADDLSATGNGMKVVGLDGNDILRSAGFTGLTLQGGAGDDVYYVEQNGTTAASATVIELAGGGTDTIHLVDLHNSATGLAIPDGVEDLIVDVATPSSVSGNASDNHIIGNGANDTLYGAGGDDILEGKGGNDRIYGGDGNDIAVINATRAQTTIHVLYDGSLDLTGPDGLDYLANDVETIRFTDQDVATSSLYIKGTNGADTLTGTSGDDVIIGFVGNDVIDGGPGADVMSGGFGDDTYYVDNPNDQVIEDSQGFNSTDTVITSVSMTIPLYVEVLRLASGANATLSAGSNGSAILQGNELGTTLSAAGSLSFVTLSGGGGGDTLIGGAHTLFLDTAAGLNGDTIVGFHAYDRIVISDASIGNFAFSLSGNTLTYTGGSLTLSGIAQGHLSASAAPDGGVAISLVTGHVAGDFSGDAHSDILWRNANSGKFGDWKGNSDATFAPNSNLYSASLDWKIAGNGDFDGDGHADILWRNDNGQLGTWSGIASDYFNPNPTLYGVTTDWKIAATGDFNGDGRDDILWRNINSGQTGIWTGNADKSFTPNANLYGVGAEWKIAGAGDFNGDGNADILWRNILTGQTGDWMGNNDGSFTANPTLYGVSGDWKIAATGDFNGDGRDDILWRNASSGQTGIWTGNGNQTFTPNASLYGVSGDWKIMGAGDFNGDGRDDILWRNDNGQTGSWSGNADGSFAPNATMYGVTSDWVVQLPHDLLI